MFHQINCLGEERRYVYAKKWGDAAPNKPLNFPQPKVSKNIEPFPKKLYRDPAFLHKKYVEERLSIKEISRLTFSSRGAIRNAIRRAGIKLRDQKQQGKTKGQLGFGQAWKQHRLTVHKRELEVVRKMLSLRAKGLSFSKIAAILNAWEIPTKTRKGKWTGKQIHQILKRFGY